MDTDEPEHRLKKDLTALDLMVFGVGVTIGAGIFILTGRVAATTSGPAVALSFLIAAIACGLAAICYAEFASTVPVAGSAYTFSYATLGELVAWIIGWDLILEFVIGAAAVASGWSGYLASFLAGTPFELPAAITSAEEGAINLPAGLLVLALAGILVLGIKLSSRVNQVVVAIKVGIVLFVIIAGIGFINTANYSPFIPARVDAPEGSTGFLETPLVQTLFGIEPAVFGWGRARHGCGHRVLRVHRIRRRGDNGRGDARPAARPPARHPRRPRHLCRAVRRCVVRDHRDAELRRHRPR